MPCRSPLAVDSKADTSPVTEADRQAEAAMKAIIHENFPGHDIFGEEGGIEPGRQPGESDDPKYLWVIDPIDGTKSFITGKTVSHHPMHAGNSNHAAYVKALQNFHFKVPTADSHP